LVVFSVFKSFLKRLQYYSWLNTTYVLITLQAFILHSNLVKCLLGLNIAMLLLMCTMHTTFSRHTKTLFYASLQKYYISEI